jgi:hypothetical protein
VFEGGVVAKHKRDHRADRGASGDRHKPIGHR